LPDDSKQDELPQIPGRDLPEGEYLIPLGLADIKREGEHVTVVATALMVHRALEAAVQLEREGILLEVVDPRTLVPLDKETILQSVRKTNRALVVTEETRTASCAAEIAAMISEDAFDDLDAPVMRLGMLDAPIPFAPAVQQAMMPNTERIVAAVRKLTERII
jgi:pyruvate dehydrogenase E1 component beta subunit